jgi:hypothetical protein
MMGITLERFLVIMAIAALVSMVSIVNNNTITPDEAALWILNNDTKFENLHHRYIKVAADTVGKYNMLPYLEVLETSWDYTIDITEPPSGTSR